MAASGNIIAGSLMSGHPLVSPFRKALGVIPVVFEKTELKDDLELNPHSRAMFSMFLSGKFLMSDLASLIRLGIHQAAEIHL
jgi:hypothetical protein